MKKEIIICLSIALFIILSGLSISDLIPIQGYWKFDEWAYWSSGTLSNLQTGQATLALNPVPDSVKYIWVANSGENTISKINSETGKEEARYYTGPKSTENPSRTAMDKNGDIWVANRGGSKNVIKIISDHSRCLNNRDGNSSLNTSIDANNNGKIDIVGAQELKSWGTDECVVINTSANSNGIWALAIDNQGYIWAGEESGYKYHKLNPDTGVELKTLSVNYRPFGAIIGNDGFLWSASRDDWGIERIDTVKEIINKSVKTDSSTTDYPTYGGYDHDHPWGIAAYGNYIYITDNQAASGVLFSRYFYNESDGLIYINDYHGDRDYRDASIRGSHCVAVAGGWYDCYCPTPNWFGSDGQAITIDKSGNVWVAEVWGTAAPHRIIKYSFNPSTNTYTYDLSVNVSNIITCSFPSPANPTGVILDKDGYLWSVNKNYNNLTKIDSEGNKLFTIPVGTGPETYSDASGAAIKQFFMDGSWQKTLTNTMGCTDNDFSSRISWTASNLNGGTVKVEVKNSTASSFTQVSQNSIFNYKNSFTVKITITRNTDTTGSSPVVNSLTIDNSICLSGSMHRACNVNNQCVYVAGSGADTCSSDSTCQNRPPVASITEPAPTERTFTTQQVPQNIKFNGTNSSDPDGDAITYKWDFGDNSFSSQNFTTHTFGSFGEKIVTLNVTDEHGANDSTTITLMLNQEVQGVNIVAYTSVPDGSKFNSAASYSRDGSTIPIEFNANRSYAYKHDAGGNTCLAGCCSCGGISGTGTGELNFSWRVDGNPDSSMTFTKNLGPGKHRASLNVSYGGNSSKIFADFTISGCDYYGEKFWDVDGLNHSTLTTSWCGGLDGTANCCPEDNSCKLGTTVGCFHNSIHEEDPCNVAECQKCNNTDGTPSNYVCISGKCKTITSCSSYSQSCCADDIAGISNNPQYVKCVDKRCTWSAGICIMHANCGAFKCNETITRSENTPSQGLTTVLLNASAYGWLPTIAESEKPGYMQQYGCISDNFILRNTTELYFASILGIMIALSLIILFYIRRK